MTLELNAELLAKVKMATGIDDTNKVLEEGLRVLVSEHVSKGQAARNLQTMPVRKGGQRHR